MNPVFGDGSARLGYSGVPWSFRASPSDVFYIEVDPVRRHDFSLGAEALDAARAMSDCFPGEEFHVYYSGGSDSEAILEAFRLVKAPVKAIVVEDSEGMNRSELLYAKQYFDTTKFDNFEIVTFDFMDWFKSQEAKALGDEIQTPFSMQTLLCRPTLERYRDKPITIGHLPPVIVYRDGRWWVTEPECFYSWWKFFLKYNLKGVPSFYWWSAELITSWLADSVWQNALRDGVKGEDSTNSPLKVELMRKHFGVKPRQKVSWTENQLTWNLPRSPYVQAARLVPYRKWLAQHLIGVDTGFVRE